MYNTKILNSFCLGSYVMLTTIKTLNFPTSGFRALYFQRDPFPTVSCIIPGLVSSTISPDLNLASKTKRIVFCIACKEGRFTVPVFRLACWAGAGKSAFPKSHCMRGKRVWKSRLDKQTGTPFFVVGIDELEGHKKWSEKSLKRCHLRGSKVVSIFVYICSIVSCFR